MTDKELKEIREKISCPQLNDDHYGEWGILNINQRLTIKRLLDLVDGQENYIKKQQAEIERLQNSGIRASSVEDWLDYCNGLKSEAIKEFAERLKNFGYKICKPNGDWVTVVKETNIDNLVKEMVGEEE